MVVVEEERDESSGDEKGAEDVDVPCLPKVVRVDFEQRCFGLHVAGVVDEDVDATEGGFYLE